MVAEYLEPIKLAFDTLKVGLGMIKDVKDALPSEEQRKAVAVAVQQSELQFQIAEAQMAQALGYELCKCEFPPTIMLAVGYMARGDETGKTIHECPRCNRNTAAPYMFTRTRAVESAKEPVTLRLSPETLAKLQAKGDGWRARMSEVLDNAKV